MARAIQRAEAQVPERARAAGRPVRRLATRLRALLAPIVGSPLVLLSALALALRWNGLDLARIDPPLLGTLLESAALARGEAVPLVGAPTALGLHHPPWLTYLLALPALASRDPRCALGLVALLNVAGLVGLSLVARRYYGPRAAALAAILWLVNPWTGVFAQQASAAALLAPLAVAVLYGLLRGATDRGPWGWALAVAALGAMVGLSLWALAAVPGVALALLVCRRRVSWAHALFGACVALLILSPWLYEGNLTGYTALRAALRGNPAEAATAEAAEDAEAEAPQAPARGAGEVLVAAAEVHSGAGIEAAAGLPAPEVARWPRAGRLDALAGWLAVGSLAAFWALALLAWGHWRARQDPAVHLVPAVLAWSALGALALAPVAPRAEHLAVVQPLGLLAVAVVADRFLRLVPRPAVWRQRLAAVGAGMGFVVLAAVVAWQAHTTLHAQRYAARHDVAAAGEAAERVALPLHFWRTTADLLRRQVADAGTAQVWLVREGGAEYGAAILDYLLGGRPRLVTMGPSAHLLPAGRPGVYLRLGAHTPPGAPTEAIAGAEDRGLVLSPGGAHEARVSVAEPRAVGEVLDAMGYATEASPGAGLQVLGYEWPAEVAPGERAVLTTYWTFADLAADEREHEHVVAVGLLAGGVVVAESQGLGLPERYWAEGYLLESRHVLDVPAGLPAGEYTLAAVAHRAGAPPPDPVPFGTVFVSAG